ncbi:RNA-guided endonuclease InsQ/TnpB family protein [Chloroflexota bacterium]
MRKAYKYRIYPNQGQQEALARQFGCARVVYNWGLTERKNAYENKGQSLNYRALANRLPELKAEHEWLKEADSQVLQQKLRDLDQAYDNYFRRVKAGNRPAGYPRYKSKHSQQSIRYPQRFRLSENGKKIYLPKVGWVKVKQHRAVEGEMKNCTVTKTKSGKYFVSIQCEMELPEVVLWGEPLGVDMGLIDFATFSDLAEPAVPTPKYLRKAEEKLAKLQKKLARQKKGSKSYQRTQQRVARQHEKVANQRRDFHHKLSYYLTVVYGLLAFEDLNIKGMVKNRRLAKSISDAAWGQFLQFCQYKAEWYGCAIRQVDRFFPSSKKCSVCGNINRALQLSERRWVCPFCGTELARDPNAALNILLEALTEAERQSRMAAYNAVGNQRRNAGGATIRPGQFDRRVAGKPEAQAL